jgi:stage V sporulation protein G
MEGLEMEITEVRIKLMEDSEDRLRAFCSITFDHCFVIRDLKIIDGAHGPFLAMPSRKLTSHCHRCRHKNHLRSQYCNQCGARLRAAEEHDVDQPQKLYADIAHPINSECRDKIQQSVIKEFENELRRAKEPGYRSRYDDDWMIDAGPDTDGLAPRAPIPKPHFKPKEEGSRVNQSRPKDRP